MLLISHLNRFYTILSASPFSFYPSYILSSCWRHLSTGKVSVHRAMQTVSLLQALRGWISGEGSPDVLPVISVARQLCVTAGRTFTYSVYEIWCRNTADSSSVASGFRVASGVEYDCNGSRPVCNMIKGFVTNGSVKIRILNESRTQSGLNQIFNAFHFS